MTHPDLPAEQAYVDEAYDCLDRMRRALMRAADGGATEGAQQCLAHAVEAVVGLVEVGLLDGKVRVRHDVKA